VSSGRWLRAAPALLLAGFAAQGLATAFRGIDTPDWREADVATVARNFSREALNPLAPRVDWRGDREGRVEMEPPLLPFAMALLEPWTGEDPRVGRLLSLAATLGALAIFLRLARERLPPRGAAFAGLCFACNPLLIQVATELRPEPLMLLGSLAAVFHGERWLRAGSRRDRAFALAGTAFAVFAKLPAIHLGPLLAALALRRRGARALRDPELVGFALLALLPAALWYGYARSVWLETGLSLGLSNQEHLAGLDLLRRPGPLWGVLATELRLVFVPAGVALIVAGALAGCGRRWRELELWWLASLALYFAATAPTTGEAWATYYHVVAAAPAALMFGGAADALLSSSAPSARRRRLAAGAGAVLLAATLLQSGAIAQRIVAERLPGARSPHPLKRCALDFAERVPTGARILVSGGACHDRSGYETSPHRPYFFYWMDRQGFQLCREQQSIEAIERVAERGARFLVAERRDLRRTPGLEAQLRERHTLAAECGPALLFELRSRAAAGRSTLGRLESPRRRRLIRPGHA
jgi:hypothetical protein